MIAMQPDLELLKNMTRTEDFLQLMRKNGRQVTLAGGYQNCELTNVHLPYNITSYRCVKYKQIHFLILEIINSDEAREHVGGKLALYFFCLLFENLFKEFNKKSFFEYYKIP